jgi:Tol biopolymer transport system component
VYHIPADGDPTFVREGAQSATAARQIYVAPDKLHAHFPLWSPKGDFVYFVQGAMQNNILIDNADIWRVKPDGTSPERVTSQRTYMTHPVLLDERTLVYLAKDPDGSGPAIYSMDVERGEPHRVSSGLDRYTSLAGSADGHHLVATLSNPRTTLWRVHLGDTPVTESAATPIALTTGAGFAPRLGPGYLLYVASTGASEEIWKMTGDAPVELWSAPDARVIGGPEISPDGRAVAVSVAQRGKTLLYVMNADGTQAHVVTDALELRGAPAWATDGAIVSAADVGGTPHLFHIALDGTHAPLVSDYALDPVSSPFGDFFVYSGPDVGTEFVVKAATTQGTPYALMDLKLTRGARRLRFYKGQRSLVVMEGDIEHKNLWLIDLATGKKRQLTNLKPDFTIRDFDISLDGREIVLERVQERSDIVLIDLAHRG